MARQRRLSGPYQAYFRPEFDGIDEELQPAGKGTPCGEYLRRFWQPVALASDLTDVPFAVRIMGEDLVLFRDGSGRVGLLHRYCSHRNTSLEYGKIQDRGLRCCYHGWHYDIDGRILDTPGEPEGSRLKDRVWHGAYPTHEYKGLVFAYMGPPEKKPAFPIYDLFVRPGCTLIPSKIHNPCNWLQVRENETDPVHISFLHTRLFGVQFMPVFGEIPTFEWLETPVGMIYVTVRRWGEFAYARSNDMILPNIARVAGIEDGEGETVFDRRAGSTNWVVPIDDVNCWTIGWNEDEDEATLPDRARDGYQDRRARAGVALRTASDVGQTGEPTYAERQRAPGDWDAWVSQGAITPHKRETLAFTDQGVQMYRRLVREGARAVARGEDPKGLVRGADARGESAPITTYAHNTVMRLEKGATAEDDRRIRFAFGREVTAKVLSGAYLR